ncbi:MAG: hypothetical protein U0X39_03670 [Bacteroidales bacterium]
MKKLAIIVILISAITGRPVVAQNQAIEKLNAYKIAFFTNKLALSQQEAEKFWPVYNDYQARKLNIQAEKALISRNVNLNEATMTEKELVDAADKLIDLEMKEASLALEFHKKFKEILPARKVIKLYQAENQYRQQLLNELRNNPNLQRNNQRLPGRGLK